MLTSLRPLRTALKSGGSLSRPDRHARGLHDPQVLWDLRRPQESPFMRQRVGHRVLARVGDAEQVRAREAIHVSADRQAHVVEHGRRQVDDRATLMLARCHVGAVRDQEAIGARPRASR